MCAISSFGEAANALGTAPSKKLAPWVACYASVGTPPAFMPAASTATASAPPADFLNKSRRVSEFSVFMSLPFTRVRQ